MVIDLSAEVRYKVGHLSNPERLYFDLLQTEVSPRLASRRIALRDAVVDQIRIGVGQGSVARVVLDLRSAVSYRISKLNNPARMLVELGQAPDGGGLANSPQDEPVPNPASGRTNSLTLPPERATNLQGAPSHSERDLGPQTHGLGEKAGLSYAGTVSPRNVLLLGLDFGSSYDDNIFGNGQQRIGDTEFRIGPSLSLRREGNQVSLALSYVPHFLIYRKASELNRLDQQLGFDASYRATSRLSFRGRTNASYSNGLFQPGQNEGFVPGVGSPSNLNQTVYTPTVRQLSLSSRIDAGYQVGPHDSVDLSVGESLLNFEQQIANGGNLQNTRETNAGLDYQHQLSPHATVGADYLFQNIYFGADSRTQVHSAFFSYSQQFSPSLTASIFGGPQHSGLHELLSLSFGPFTAQIPFDDAMWSWALGGTLTKRLDRTVFQLTAQHQVSNGGGLIGAVVGTSLGASLRQRLPGRWDAVWSGNYAKNSSLGSRGPASDYQSETAGFGLEHPVTDKLSLRVGYDFLRQRGTGQGSLVGDVDRDLFSIQFSYRLHQIALSQ